MFGVEASTSPTPVDRTPIALLDDGSFSPVFCCNTMICLSQVKLLVVYTRGLIATLYSSQCNAEASKWKLYNFFSI